MEKMIHIQIADAAGNITIFVLDQTPREDYQQVATQLLAMEELGGEQVAFVTGEDAMEMCGLEFCGNASRSFALMRAKAQETKKETVISINVSGCSDTLHVFVDTKKNFTKIKMPTPISIQTLSETGIPFLDGGSLVDLDGIMHVVLTDVTPSQENFDTVRNYIQDTYNPPAMGTMFYDTKTNKLTPVVYVRDVDTTYFEGSCGSGSTAVAAAFSAGEKNGTFQFDLEQPAGSITSTIEKAHGETKAVYIQGPVFLSEVKAVTVHVPEQ